MVEDRRAYARHGDPETSHQAAASVRDLRATQWVVLSILRRFGPCSDEQIADHAATEGVMQSPSGMRTRRRELVDLGFVIDSGERTRTEAGRNTIVWRAKR